MIPMRYDFTSIMDRRGRDAIAVDAVGSGGSSFAPRAPKEGFSLLPMWVADMNFATVPTVTEAIIERSKHPAFGYFAPREEYFDAIIRWQTERNGVSGLEKEHIGYENGVLGCVSSAILALTAPGEKVLLHSPTYIGFTGSLAATGRVAELSPLRRDEKGVWRMDFEDMERRLQSEHIHLAILCSPHNPCGRVWERWELEQAMEIFRRNSCYVISDEIWSDILLNGHRHIPTQSVSEDARARTVAVYAPSKTFNLAGLIGSYHIIYDGLLRDRLRHMSQVSHYNNMNVLSMYALIGAYRPEGYQWVDELCQVLSANVDLAYDYFAGHVEGVTLAKPEGTYMLFLHCEEWCRAHGMSRQDLLRAGWDVGVGWQDGEPFHDPWGIRVNLALPHSLVEEALSRLDRYVF